MIRPLALILALCVPVAVAADCQRHECSDDVDGILGNEQIAWDVSEGATYYEVKRSDQDAPCLTPVEETSALVAGTPCVEPDATAWLHVRACNDAGCSDWVGSVEFIPFACFEQPGEECETLCYAEAFYRLEEKYEPCP
jgi:hypothetical protein